MRATYGIPVAGQLAAELAVGEHTARHAGFILFAEFGCIFPARSRIREREFLIARNP